MPGARQDAIAMLKADHRKVEALFEAFEMAATVDKQKAIAEQICTELTLHAMLEEGIFYPACRSTIARQQLVEEALVEHDAAKVLIAELLGGSPDQEFYEAKVKVLSETVRHHVKEEEKRSEGLFAQARAAGVDMDALAEQMAEEKQRLTAKFGSEGLPKQAPATLLAIKIV